MFHAFRVHSKDRDYLRFLWWEDGDLTKEPIDHRMKVHLFGAVSSPGCANFGLKQLAKDHEDIGKEAADFLQKDFYVDDGIKSVETVNEGVDLIMKAREICAKGNLRLHKIVSNSREVMERIPETERAKSVKNLDLDLDLEDSPIERALGIQWCLESDSFCFRLTLKDQPLTRRGILSTVASIYDPLGFVAPFVLLGKKLLQQMCGKAMNWDDPLPDELRPLWEQWRLELGKLSAIKISRCYKPQNFGETKTAELHHFSDASLSGYGQCSYLRLVDDKKQVHCSLVMGKSRVAPLKPVTIPRLELQAAVVSTKISDLLNRELDIANITNIYWTDSKVVLGYINNEARRFHIFVANRVQRIRDSTEVNQWRYVSTHENPADLASRGCSAEEIESSDWLVGPAFLRKDEIPIDKATTPQLLSDDPDVKKIHAVNTVRSFETRTLLHRIGKFSTWSSAVSAVAVLLRCCLRKKGTNHPPHKSSVKGLKG
ncbi:uncharacterized protein LOC135496529 [Lineus longissimus]|uniref:uncharacterized protein LOC135496529 n=1 Tax=Lineus longissimus TaxID=88925 RepID=UPI00315C8470